jgi:hypothetical protein
MFELGTSVRVRALPFWIGINPYPLLEAIRAPAKTPLLLEIIVIDRAFAGTRQVAISLPLTTALTVLPFINLTWTLTEIESPEKTTSGESPVTASDIGIRAGVAVLHTKSLCLFTVTVDKTEARIGSGDVIRTAKALAEIFGANENSETTPALIDRELIPTGIKLPSEDKTSRVNVVSTSPGVRIRKVCDEDAF